MFGKMIFFHCGNKSWMIVLNQSEINFYFEADLNFEFEFFVASSRSESSLWIHLLAWSWVGNRTAYLWVWDLICWMLLKSVCLSCHDTRMRINSLTPNRLLTDLQVWARFYWRMFIHGTQCVRSWQIPKWSSCRSIKEARREGTCLSWIRTPWAW